MKNDYYVYEHIRLDNNTCFYVGKGRGKRATYKERNEHHNRIVEKYGMKVKIIADNLSEEEAYNLEYETICNYVFNLGYGIDIIGYNNRNEEPGHLTNHTFGGDGSKGMVHSEEWRLQHSNDMTGDKNPAFGKNYWETYSKDKAEMLKEKLSIASSGKHNPMYGISPKDRMSEETYAIWLEKRRLNSIGEKNPNYGNDTLHNRVKDNPELRIQYYSRPGSQNGRARKIEIYDINMNYINTFDTIGECASWIKDELHLDSKIDGIRSNITQRTKKNLPYRNYYFKFVE